MSNSPSSFIGRCVVIFVSVFAVSFFLNSRHSGVYIDGEELNKTEADTGAREIIKMSHGSDPKIDSGMNLSVIPTSRLSRKAKEYFVAIVDARRDYEDYVAEHPIDKIFGGPFETKQERVGARRALEEYDSITIKHYDDEIRLTADYRLFSEKAHRKPMPILSMQIERTADIRSAYKNVSRARLKILDFMDSHPPISHVGDQPVFADNQSNSDCQKLAKELIDVSAKFEKLWAESSTKVNLEQEKAREKLKGI